MIIKLEEINNLITDKKIFNNAYTIFLNNKVNKLTYFIINDNYCFNAVVNDIPLEILIDKEGNILKPELNNKLENIESYIAFLFQIKKEVDSNEELLNNKTPLINKIINYYKKEYIIKDYEQLIPYMYYSDNEYFNLEFKIGYKDLNYQVKNIKDLINNFKNNNEIEYGKYYKTNHNLDNFDQTSNKIVNFLLRLDYDSLKRPEKSLKNFNKYLFLTPSLFDSFFNIFINNKIFINNDLILFKNENPFINILLTDDEMKLLDKDFTIYEGLQKSYVLKNNILYLVDDYYNDNLIPLLKDLKDNVIKINDVIKNDFFSYCYPKIKQYTTSKFDKLKIYDLKINTFIDYINEELILRYEFLYNNKKKNDEIIPNIKLENDYLNYLNKIGFKNYILKDLNKIIDFLDKDLNNLKKISNVYITNNVKSLNIIRNKKLKINVNYNQNKIYLNFDNIEYKIDDLKNIIKNYKLKKKYYKLKNEVIDLDSNFVKDINNLLDNLNIDIDKLDNNLEIPFYNALLLDNNYENLEYNANNEFKNFINELKDYKNLDYKVPDNMVNVLKPFQKEAFNWLKVLSKYDLSGILADDMGLGKTIEIISLLSDSNNLSLIVCPTSLVYNWEYELDRFGLSNRILMINGNIDERLKLIKEIKGNKIILTSYDILKNDLKYYKMEFDYLIIDEAQHIKNYKTQKAMAVKKIKSKVKFALTGTPIENNLLDLWSIFDFLLPNYLKPLNEYLQEDLDNLKIKIKPFILRRTKKQVLKDLPDKIENIIYTKLNTEQKKLYDYYLQDFLNNNKDNNKIKIFNLLTRLRQICDDPKLFIEDYKNSSAKKDLFLEVVSDYIERGHKILVFSQFATMLNNLKIDLDNLNVNNLILTGQTDKKERLNLVRKFNNDDDVKVFLISLKAGGIGLNLTKADVVIHYDPWWNISLENQATDRSHRIGQKNVVQVIKLITKNTIEEGIINLQKEKFKLSEDLLNESMEKLSYNDLINVLKNENI